MLVDCLFCIVCDMWMCVFIYCFVWVFFFFKQKTAYEMRISDWSSDVCSSDLHRQADAGVAGGRLHDRAAGLQLAGAFGILDHRERDAILDRAGGIGALALVPHLVIGAEHPAQPNMRRVADRLQYRIDLHRS